MTKIADPVPAKSPLLPVEPVQSPPPQQAQPPPQLQQPPPKPAPIAVVVVEEPEDEPQPQPQAAASVSSFPTAFAPPPGSSAASASKASGVASVTEMAASSPPGQLQLDGSEDKKFKTLTRTRKYINEAGEEVTYTTKRVVETSHVAGKISSDVAKVRLLLELCSRSLVNVWLQAI